MKKMVRASRTIRAKKRKAQLKAKHRRNGRWRLHSLQVTYFRAVGGRIVGVHRALAIVTCPPGNPRPIEAAVNAQVGSATLAQIMGCSYQLPLITGDQLDR